MYFGTLPFFFFSFLYFLHFRSCVGSAVGLGTVDKVGIVGKLVGLIVGGVLVGRLEGDTDTEVGLELGRELGGTLCCVGSVLGRRVGILEGVGVGTKVGPGDGCGDPLGASEKNELMGQKSSTGRVTVDCRQEVDQG